MTDAEQIQIAADILDREFQDKGIFGIGRAECLRLARLLYMEWQRPGGPQRHIPAGDIAQKFRDRYNVAQESGLATPLNLE